MGPVFRDRRSPSGYCDYDVVPQFSAQADGLNVIMVHALSRLTNRSTPVGKGVIGLILPGSCKAYVKPPDRIAKIL